MAGDQSVLIVDGSEETREVLSTALGRRGVRTYSAPRLGPGLRLARQVQPDLIVLDMELDDSEGEAICDPFARQARQGTTPLVVLGSVRRGSVDRPGVDRPGREFVRKPYHYGPLVRKIEELLERVEQPVARSA